MDDVALRPIVEPDLDQLARYATDLATSDTFGWLSARYLAPAHAVAVLDECPPEVLAAPPAPTATP